MNKSSPVVATKRRALQVFLFSLAFLAVQMVPIQQLQAAGGKPLLLLADAETAGTDDLVEALAAAGYEVTVVFPEWSWDGIIPPLDGFQCVVHLNGVDVGVEETLPTSVQEALVDFVRNGGGFIGGQYNGLEQLIGSQIDMPDLVLQLYSGEFPFNCSNCNVTWAPVAGQENHPVLKGVGTFIYKAGAHDAGPMVVFDQYPSTLLMTAPSAGDGPAVIVRELEQGRVVSFSSVANQLTDTTLQDFNIQTLYVNAADWVTRSSETVLPVPQCNSPGTITPPDAPISVTATADGGFNYSVEITDYDCYKINKRGKRIDKTGSCRVSYTDDTLTVERTGGVGTHIAWTAVTMDSLGNMSEEALCEVKVVRPGKHKDKDDDDDKGKKKRSKKCKKNR